MRTKTLLLTAALGAAGVASAIAQVYSVNAVGYVNTTLTPGFNLIANPLDAGAGNNTVGKLFGTAMAEGTTVYKYDPVTGLYTPNTFEFGAWSLADQPLEPGEGAFVNNKGASVTVTFVGEVMQSIGGVPLTTPIPAGFSIKSSKVPQSGQLDTVLGFPVAEGDTVYLWDNTTSAYKVCTYEFGSWSLAPVPKVGEAFFVKKVADAVWSRTFSVNP